MKKDIFKLGIALALFAAGACAALAVVHTATKDTIAGHAERQLLQSQKDLFPQAGEFQDISANISSTDPQVRFAGAWRAVNGNAVIGVIIKAVAPSYSGDAEILVGIGTDRRIAGARILSLVDTPGLGANANNPKFFVERATETTFPGQFSGKGVSDRFEVGDDVLGITASTITSKALTAMVKQASLAGSAWLEANAAGGN